MVTWFFSLPSTNLFQDGTEGVNIQHPTFNLKDAPMAPCIQQECPYLLNEIAFRASANNITFCEVIGAKRKSRFRAPQT
jgi:hypothetical protein